MTLRMLRWIAGVAVVALGLTGNASMAGIWTRLSPTNVADVTTQGDEIWIVKYDGTVWRANNAQSAFTNMGASGAARIAAANCLPGGGILAVHRDGTVWRYALVPSPNPRQPMVMAWRKLPWTNVADIASTGHLVFFDGATGLGASPTNAALRSDNMAGFKRAGGTACSTDLFFVGHNGSLWFLDPFQSRFTPKQTPASEMADVDVSKGKVWLVGKNGTVWWSFWGAWPGSNGFQWQWLEARQFDRNKQASGFESIAAYNTIGALAVGWNGTLWLYRQDPSERQP